MTHLVFLVRGAFRPFRCELPDDGEVLIGRGDGDAPTVQRDGDRCVVRLPDRSLSERHATLRLRGGEITVIDHSSRNGTYLRLEPSVPQPLDGGSLRLGADLTLHLDAARWDVPTRFDPPTAESLCDVLRARLGPRGAVVALGGAGEVAWRVEGEASPVVVRAEDPSRTLSSDDLAWARLVVNAFNTAVASARAAKGWRFTAVSPERRRVLAQCQRAAGTSLPVLILGPTGVGKDVLAQDLHDHSAHAEGPFVALNCAELSADRLESQLFGHARGAFTGAVSEQQGLVERAAGGTLFLDEVAEMPTEVQAKLLRYLESERGEYRRMGEARTRAARVRVIAATHRDITRDDSAFRRDLYFRLAGVVVHVPPAAQSDIDAIVREFVGRRDAEGIEVPRGDDLDRIAADAAQRTWSGGVRALRQSVERCLRMRDPALTWMQNWREACGAETVVTREPTMSEVPPAVVARLVSDVLFLAAACTAASRGALARGLGMTYQGVDQRLQSLGLSLADRAAVNRRYEESVTTLRETLARNPGLSGALQGALGA